MIYLIAAVVCLGFIVGMAMQIVAFALLRGLDAKVSYLIRRQTADEAKEQTMNQDVQDKLTALKAAEDAEATEVAKSNALATAAVAAMVALTAQVAGLKGTTTDPAVLSAIDAVTAEAGSTLTALTNSDTALAAGITANTPPAAPPTA